MNRVGVQFDGSSVGAIAAAKQTVTAIDGVTGAAGRSRDALGRFTKGNDEATHSVGRSSQPLRNMEKDLGRVERGALAGSGALHGMGRAALYLGGTYIGAFGLGAAFKAASAELGAQVRLTAQARAELISTGGVAGVTAKAIDALAHAESQKSAVDANQIKTAELMILRYTQVRDVAGQGNDIFTRATKASLDLAAALGIDASQAAATLGRALQDPIKGVSTLQRARVALTAAEAAHIKEVAKSGNVLAAQKLLLDAVARSYGGTAVAVGNAEPWVKLKNTLTTLSADVLRPLLPQFDSVTSRVQRWADGLEHNSAMQQRLKADVQGVIGPIKDFAKGANAVAGFLGGWKNALELVLALKLASTLNGWTGALKAFIGSEATASGVAGASAETGLLAARLKILRGLASTPFKILIAYEIIKKLTDSNADLSNNTSASDLLPVWKDGKWVDPNTGNIAADQAKWNAYFKKTHSGGEKPQTGQSAGQPAGNAKQRAVVATAQQLGPSSGGIYVWGGTGGQVVGSSAGGNITFVPGFDCSGYLYDIYKKNGINIPRDTRGQWNDPHAEKVAPGQEKPGDGVYFTGDRSGANAGPPPGHVGIYIGGGQYIEYYQSGKPAKVANLADASDYMGARRWIKIVQQTGGKTGADSPTGTDTSSGSKNPLPVGVRQAISAADVAAASAALTPGKADDKAAIAQERRAIEDEIAWLNAKLATKLGPEKRITYEDLLAGALGNLQGLSKTKKAGGAGISTVMSMRTAITESLRNLPPVLDDVEQTAVTKLEALRAHLKVGLSTSDLAATRASIKHWGNILKDEISKQAKVAADAAADAAKMWQRSWTNDVNLVLRDFDEKIAGPQLDKFDRETSAHLKTLQDKLAQQLKAFDAETRKGLASFMVAQTPEEKAYADFVAKRAADAKAKQRADLQQQIADTQLQLDALGTGATGTLIDIATGARTAITGAALTNARKTLQDQLLALQQQFDQLQLDDQEATLKTAADNSRTAADEQTQAAQDAYQQQRDDKRAAIEAQAADDQQAYNDERTAARQHLNDILTDQRTALQNSLDDWQQNIADKKANWLDFLQWLRDNGYDTSNVRNPGASGNGSGNASPGSSTLPRFGKSIPFASGGRVPGMYVGRDDTILARLTPGETVIDRRLTAALEEMVANGGSGGPTVAIFALDGREFARVTAQPMTAEQARQIGYTIQRG